QRKRQNSSGRSLIDTKPRQPTSQLIISAAKLHALFPSHPDRIHFARRQWLDAGWLPTARLGACRYFHHDAAVPQRQCHQQETLVASTLLELQQVHFGPFYNSIGVVEGTTR